MMWRGWDAADELGCVGWHKLSHSTPSREGTICEQQMPDAGVRSTVAWMSWDRMDWTDWMEWMELKRSTSNYLVRQVSATKPRRL